MLLVLALTHVAVEVCCDMMRAHEQRGLIEWRILLGNTGTAISCFAQIPASLSWLLDVTLSALRERFAHTTAGDVF